METVVGRADLLAEARAQLAAGRRVVLRGPAEAGLSTVLAAVAEACGALLVRAPPPELSGPYAVLADLLAAVPQESLAGLPQPQRRAVDVVLRRVPATGEPVDRVALRLAVADLARRWGPGPLLLAVDDAHLIDPGSAEVLEHALGAARAGLILAERAGRRSPLADLAEVELRVPPLSGDGVADLLTALGLPSRCAGQIHLASGGLPRWVVEFGRAAPSGRGPLPLPPAVRALAGVRLAALPSVTRDTLLLAALARRPGVPLLRRAGRRDAERDLAPAVLAGLVELSPSGALTFAATAIADTLVHDADWERRAAGHRALAEATEEPPERALHRALATELGGVDAALAAELALAAQEARATGERTTAAELELLAAERTPRDQAGDLVRRVVAAARDAAAAGRFELAQRAESLLERIGSSHERARARLSIIEVMGQDFDGLGDTFARALADAAGDPGLEAEVHLHLAIRANITDGNPLGAREEAVRSAELAVLGGDRVLHAAALTMQARIERIIGDPRAEVTLARALAVQPDPEDGINRTPQFLAARHALFDDRLADAHALLSSLLPPAERSGAAWDLVDVLRGLAEVEVRRGRCAAATAYAGRALSLTEASGLSPGPAWYTAAVTESAAGSPHRAQAYAVHGSLASREEHDVVYLARNLHALGTVRLAAADTEGALEALLEVRDLEDAQGVVDPSLLRWHGDLVIALTGAGRLRSARLLLDETRPVAIRLGARGVLAALERAEGDLLAAEGDLAGASELLAEAAERFGALGLVLERGRTLLALAQVTRRRRRRTEARAILALADELFTAAQAGAWVRLTHAAAARLESTVPPDRTGRRSLTETEARVATLVARGASNREVAGTLFLSVKTVEATLTRVYRKVGVRSRAQLARTHREPQGFSQFRGETPQT